MLPLGKNLFKTICKHSSLASATLQSLQRALACQSLTNHYFYKNSLTNMYNGQEVLALADEKDQPVGKGLRNNSDWVQGYQRCASVLLASPKGEFYVQKRAGTKAYCPGYFDITFGGMVRFGESYLYSAYRELVEEVGLQMELKPLFKYLYEDEKSNSRTWCQVFLGIVDDKEANFQFTDNEVSEVVKMTPQQIEELIFQKEKFTPDSLHAFKNYQNFNQSPY